MMVEQKTERKKEKTNEPTNASRKNAYIILTP